MSKLFSVFELSSEQIKLKQILNQDFLELEIKAISNDYPNRNGSYFSIDSMKKSLHTFYNKPILGYFKNGDFVSHNGTWREDSELDQNYWDTENGERILGLIRESDKIEIAQEGKQTWIKLTCVLYVQYVFQQVKKILKDKKKKISVEIEVLERHIDDKGIMCIDSFKLMGITILGTKNGVPVQEGIQGASLSVLNFMEQSIANRQQEALCFAYNQLNSSGEGAQEQKEEKNNKEENQIVNDQIVFSVNKSKENISYDSYLITRDHIKEMKKAENFAEIVPEMFLSVQEGWQEDDSKLKYPIMELKENELFYNFNAMESAKFYAEISNNEKVLEGLKELYTSLDLEFKPVEKQEFYDILCGNAEILKLEQEKSDLSEALQEKTEIFENLKKEHDLLKESSEKAIFDLKEEHAKAISDLEVKHIAELEQFNDYEKLKTEHGELKEEVFKFNCEKRIDEANLLMDESFSKEEKNQIIDKCKKGQYVTYNELKQEIGLIMLEQKIKTKNKTGLQIPLNMQKPKEEKADVWVNINKYIQK